MYSFEGHYRKGPVQSLGGSSKKEQLDSLIERTQNERRKREEEKLRLLSAIKIQSCYRSYKSRQHLKAQCRQDFDRKWQSAQGSSLDNHTLCELCRLIIFFYEEQVDQARLVSMCQLVIKQKTTSVKHFYANYSNFHQLKHLILLCCNHLQVISSSATPPAIPLRMLEIFTDVQILLTNVAHIKDNTKMFHSLLAFLVNNKYFHCLKTLLEAKVPGDLEKSTKAPTPLAASILALILSPLASFNSGMDTNTKYRILQCLSSEILCQPFSPQIHKFFLPSMAADFPVRQLLHSLVPVEVIEQSFHAEWNLTVDATVWLLVSILTLCENLLEQFSEDDFKLYLLILHKLVPTLRSSRRKPIEELSDDDDDDEEEMDYTECGQNGSLGEVQLQCLQSLDNPKHVMRVVAAVGHDPSPEILIAIATVCYALIVQNKMFVHNTRLLYSLAFNPVFVRHLWQTCRTVTTVTATRSDMNLMQLISAGLPMSEENLDRIVPLLFLFCSLFSHSLHSLHDSDFFREESERKTMQPFTVDELIPMSVSLRDACLGTISLAHPESRPNLGEDYKKAFSSVSKGSAGSFSVQKHRETLAYLFRVMSLLVKQLYARDSRRQFCPLGSWLSPYVNVDADKLDQLYKARENIFARRPFGALSALNPHRVEDEGPSLSNTEVKKLTVLTELPFVVPFAERVRIFQRLVHHERYDHQGDMRHLGGGPQINILVRRNYLYEDAFEKLSADNEPNLKLRTQVQLVNFAGLDEAGIDGGGIFREFMSELIKTAFDPNRGFFKHTRDQLLYPNPESRLLVEDFTKHYYFLGRILGKVIFENMLIELPFANFFLSKILSRHRGDVDINHLASLDPEMYKNLLFLKTYEGDVADLGLDFTVVNNDLGEAQVEELKPGGRDLIVNTMNRIEYIHLMADYRLNKQIRAHCAAFRQGLADVVNIDWLRMFDHNELQVLISGAHIPIDIGDLRQHTNYSGPYNAEHAVIKDFWTVVEGFTDVQKRQLLKFVTSCSRPPLLGFKELYPAFCVHYAGSEDRLPTASTCMNLLKLPEYPDTATLAQKLIYAIESGSGFELS